MGRTILFHMLLLIMAAVLAACDNQGAAVSGAATRVEGEAATAKKGQRQAAAVDGTEFGVAIYPGAELEESMTGFIKNAGLQGASFRTSDEFSQVVAFYTSQPGLKAIGQASSAGAMFGANCMEEYNPVTKENVPMECAINVSIQSPWLHMTTNEMMTDTLVTIGKNTPD